LCLGVKPAEMPEPRLSQQLELDALWDALSVCLTSLAKMPDSHAVLVLQPTVEAFFLVHAGLCFKVDTIVNILLPLTPPGDCR